VLLKKGWIRPGYCVLCKHNSEDISHLFNRCGFTKSVWAHLAQQFNSNLSWNEPTLNECMESWLQNRAKSKILPLATAWYIWKERNSYIFEDKKALVIVVVLKILGAITIKSRDNNKKALRLKAFFRIPGYTLAFFDGAAEAGGNNYGAGGTLKCLEAPDYKWFINCSAKSNTKVELVGAWATLTIANLLDLKSLQALGDSKVIID